LEREISIVFYHGLAPVATRRGAVGAGVQQARQRAQAKRGLRELAALEDQAQQAAAKVIPAVNIPET